MTGRVYFEDMRRHNYCMAGSKLFAAKHNLDFEDFLRNGIAFEVLLETGSPAARKIVALVKQDSAQRGKNGR